MRITDESDAPLGVNLIPMIDILFVLLIFVILMSFGAARIAGLPVELPDAQTAENTDVQPLTITIQATGAIALNQTPVTLDQLVSQLQSQTTTGQIILINADTQVAHGRVVQVLDRVRQIPGLQIAIATDPLPEPTPMNP